MDLGVDGAEPWWFNLRTREAEHGSGAPNMERLGPFATKEEAEMALEHARERSEAWDAQDED